MLFAIVSIVLMTITGLITLCIRRKWTPLIAFLPAVLNLLTQFLVRWEIHFQLGFVDTQSGIGFYLLACCSVLLFLICFLDLSSIPHYVPVKKKNPALIDELER